MLDCSRNSGGEGNRYPALNGYKIFTMHKFTKAQKDERYKICPLLKKEALLPID